MRQPVDGELAFASSLARQIRGGSSSSRFLPEDRLSFRGDFWSNILPPELLVIWLAPRSLARAKRALPESSVRASANSCSPAAL